MRSAFLQKFACTSLLAVTMVVVAAESAFATHLRYGTITYSQNATNPRIVTFQITSSWRRSYPWNVGTINVGTVIPMGNGGVTFFFGDGASASPLMTVTSINPTDDYFTAVATVTHTYPNGANRTAYFVGCCRLSVAGAVPGGLQNNGDTGFYVWTSFSTAALNHPPTVAVPPIVTLAAGFADSNFQLPANDIDGDPLTYRLATAAEICGPSNIQPAGNCVGVSQPPGLTVDANGLVHFNTLPPRAPNQTWNTQLVISDGKSSTPVDFLIRLITQTSQFPVSLINGSAGPYTTSVRPGTVVGFTMTGTDPDAGATVTLAASGVPIGAMFSPGLPNTGVAPRSATFTWTPTLAQAGFSFNINLIVTDNTGLQDLNSALITVLQNLKPTVGCPTTPRTVYIDASGLSPVSLSLPVDDPDEDDVEVTWQLAAAPFTVFGQLTTAPANDLLVDLEHSFNLGTYVTKIIVDDHESGPVECPLTVEVKKASQTITFDAIPDQPYGAAPLTLVATASSGLPVIFSVVSGPASIAGGEATFTATGNVTIEASQLGDDIYAPAVSQLRSFSVSPVTPSISVSGGTFTYDGSAHPATAHAEGVGGTPLPVSVTYNGSVDSPINAGSYDVVASFGGNANYNAASATATIVVEKKGLAVAAANASKMYGQPNPPFTATYSGFAGTEDSGVLGGVLGFSTPATDTSNVAGYAITPSGVTSNNYQISFVDGTLTVKAVALTVTAGSATRAYGAENPPFTASYSGFVLAQDESVLGGALSFTTTATATSGVGTYPITPGGLTSSNYSIAFVNGVLTIEKAGQTITFGALADKTFNDADFALSATASSGLTVSFAALSGPCTLTGNNVHITGVGTCTVRATQSGGDNHHAAPEVDRSFTIAKANQTITFAALQNKTFGDADFALGASASSGMPVSFQVLVGECTVAGSTAHITGAGNCSIRASQAGNENYHAASDVDRSFSIAKASQTIVLNPPPPASAVFGTTFNIAAAGGGSGNAVGITTSGGCTVSAGGAGAATIQMNSGTNACAVTFNQAGNANYNAAGTIVITTSAQKAPQTLLVTTPAPAALTYGSTFTVAATGGASGMPVTFTSPTNDGCSDLGPIFAVTSGVVACEIRFNQNGNDNYSPAPQITQPVNVIGYVVDGFFAPVDMSTPLGTVWNRANAGQAIPAKWRLTLNGVGVSSPASFVNLLSYAVNCNTGTAAIEDPIEEYASGESGLQYDGDGQFQFNWKTPVQYKNSCRAMYVSFSDGSMSKLASFKFR